MAGREDGSLVDLIYDVALEPAQWVSVIGRMADLLGGTGGWLSQLNFVDGSGGHLQDPMAGVDKSWVPKYMEHFSAIKPFATAADPQDFLANWTPRILTNDDEVPRDELVRTELSTTGCAPRTSHRP